MATRKDIEPTVYRIDRPAGAALPIVLDSPHSGHDYPADFAPACLPALLRAAEDSAIDRLFAGGPRYGATLLAALFPRTYIDPNRAADDIDPGMITGGWRGARPTSRANAGIGLLRRLVKPGIRLYDRRLTQDEVQNRLDAYYHPYHQALAHLLTGSQDEFGAVWHLNCHAMPAHQPADFVLGDRDGTSCAPGFTAFVQNHLTSAGFRVARNDPYKGVEILRRHGDPARGRHSLQLEINKSLYWDAAAEGPNKNYSALQAALNDLLGSLAGFVTHELDMQQAAD